MGEEIAICELCGEPMPKGEEMFKIHGYSGNCPKPPIPRVGALDLLDQAQEIQRGLERQIAELKEDIQGLQEWRHDPETLKGFDTLGTLQAVGHWSACPVSKEFQERWYPFLKKMDEKYPVTAPKADSGEK